MLDLPGFGPDTEIVIRPDGPRGEGFRLDIDLYTARGDQRGGVLLLDSSMAGGQLEGTLATDDTVLLVRLVRDNATGGVPICCDTFNDQDMADLPGIGVYGPTYKLRNVPEGQRLTVRDAPSRTAEIAGSLSRDAVDILVLGCSPDIDSLTFEPADLPARLRLLNTSWWVIRHDSVSGHVAGIYLQPMTMPERQ